MECAVTDQPPYQSGQCSRVSHGEIAVLVCAQQADIAIDTTGNHRHGGPSRLDNHIGSAFDTTHVDERIGTGNV